MSGRIPAPPRRRHPDRRQRELLLPIHSPAGSRGGGSAAAAPESFGAEATPDLRAADAASFEQSLLAIIARELQSVPVEYAADIGNCRERTIENIRQGLNLPRLNTFLRPLGGRANMAAAIFAELRRRGLLDPQTAAAIAAELGRAAEIQPTQRRSA